MNTDREADEALARAEAFGVDLTSLSESLKLSPTERLRRHEEAIEFVDALRRAGKKKYGSFSQLDQGSVSRKR